MLGKHRLPTNEHDETTPDPFRQYYVPRAPTKAGLGRMRRLLAELNHSSQPDGLTLAVDHDEDAELDALDDDGDPLPSNKSPPSIERTVLEQYQTKNNRTTAKGPPATPSNITTAPKNPKDDFPLPNNINELVPGKTFAVVKMEMPGCCRALSARALLGSLTEPITASATTEPDAFMDRVSQVSVFYRSGVFLQIWMRAEIDDDDATPSSSSNSGADSSVAPEDGGSGHSPEHASPAAASGDQEWGKYGKASPSADGGTAYTDTNAWQQVSAYYGHSRSRANPPRFSDPVRYDLSLSPNGGVVIPSLPATLVWVVRIVTCYYSQWERGTRQTRGGDRVSLFVWGDESGGELELVNDSWGGK